jgi:hypothetical protein
MTHNTATRNEMAAAFAALYSGGTLEIRTSGGTTLLATITLPTPAFGSPSTGVVSRNGTWSATASTSGTAAVGRFRSADTLKTTDFTIGTSGQELNLDNVSIIAGGTVTINSFTYTFPAS